MKEITCPVCLGLGEFSVDVGGVTPWGTPIDIGKPCEDCAGTGCVDLEEKQQQAFSAWRIAINRDRSALRELTDRAVLENQELQTMRSILRDLNEIFTDIAPDGRWIGQGSGNEVYNLSRMCEALKRGQKALALIRQA